MTKEQQQACNLIPILQAFANGQEVQWYSDLEQEWLAFDAKKHPAFPLIAEWRIKPEEVEVKAWALISQHGVIYSLHQSREAAEINLASSMTTKKIIELSAIYLRK